jgi:hypothetical protein
VTDAAEDEDFDTFAKKLMASDPYMLNIFDMGDGTYIAIKQLMFTAAIIRGDVGDYCSYSDRWCYHDQIGAVLATLEWLSDKSMPEPNGWHRHPMTGRRRPDGDPSQEYVLY